MASRLLREVISVVLTLAIVFVAIPLSLAGAIALGGGLSDTTDRKDVLLGLGLLGIAALFWGALLAWFVMCGLLPMRWRFSVRTMLIVTRLISVVLGLAVYGAS